VKEKIMEKDQDIPILKCCGHIQDAAGLAHNGGKISYLTLGGRRMAAVVPVGGQASAVPASSLDAAYKAAFPGLPEGMTEEDARQRLNAALNAAFPHLADLLDKAFREGAGTAASGSWRKFELNAEEPDNPSADALARHIGDHPLGTIQAAMRILGWSMSFSLQPEEQLSGRWAVTDPGPDFPGFPRKDSQNQD
jgi:hypothetical protein